MILTLDDAKAQLNLDPGLSTHDEELQTFVDAAVDAVEGYVGAVDAVSVTETVQASGNTFVLNRLPVLVLTSITDVVTESVVDADLWVVDGASGVARCATFGRAGSIWHRTLRVMYVAGRDRGAASVNLAARIIAAHLWTTQRGASARTRPTGDVTVVPGLAFAVPNRALQLLERYRSLPGMA